ncbi:MAG TPA: DUF99 family protein [Burkholderiales bacterium]|nr:DUF99 family protein [Burkholderiales bacterium]
MAKNLTHIIAFDDAPFEQNYRGDVLVVGAVYAGLRLDAVLSGKVRRDGANATRVLTDLVRHSRFRSQTHAVLLQGIALAGFNVVNLDALHAALGIPVISITRRKANLEEIRSALLNHVPGGKRKWQLIERAGPMERLGGVYIQRRGTTTAQTEEMLRRFAIHSKIPEPLRSAHLIAGGITRGESRHRV